MHKSEGAHSNSPSIQCTCLLVEQNDVGFGIEQKD